MKDFIEAYAESSETPLLTADGFDAAILGVAEGCSRPSVVIYDYDKCVAILMERDGMEEGEANKFMQFNVVGAYLGEHTPMFLRRPPQ